MFCNTVIVSLVLRLQPRDEEKPCFGRGLFRSREVAVKPRALGLLLEPVYIVAANTEANAQGARESGCFFPEMKRGRAAGSVGDWEPGNTDTHN